jgi:hypothetical protein
VLESDSNGTLRLLESKVYFKQAKILLLFPQLQQHQNQKKNTK